MKKLNIGQKINVIATLDQLRAEGISRNKATDTIKRKVAIITAIDEEGFYTVQYSANVSFSFPRNYLRKVRTSGLV